MKKYLIKLNSNTFIICANRMNIVTTTLRGKATRFSSREKALSYCKHNNLLNWRIENVEQES